MFVCLPALFYLGVFADHSRDWPRNVTVLCRADWTPESAMEASDFLLEREARDTSLLMKGDGSVKCCSPVAVN